MALKTRRWKDAALRAQIKAAICVVSSVVVPRRAQRRRCSQLLHDSVICRICQDRKSS
ncbi:hypothetical protein HYDPIDRAFT_111278 [Hydnomerulius pinastri MD-312]|uniref:Uncharacterized protein n=1 Tax=Hydnomerulius pinastri MD-312 TaxID=994086 RepID=A0A0C9WG29_9AGAM|nr:hypothetical protein HYDPIDRAFT_111278 [Hydnomerulius pinastri MD-312]